MEEDADDDDAEDDAMVKEEEVEVHLSFEEEE